MPIRTWLGTWTERLGQWPQSLWSDSCPVQESAEAERNSVLEMAEQLLSFFKLCFVFLRTQEKKKNQHTACVRSSWSAPGVRLQVTLAKSPNDNTVDSAPHPHPHPTGSLGQLNDFFRLSLEAFTCPLSRRPTPSPTTATVSWSPKPLTRGFRRLSILFLCYCPTVPHCLERQY